MLWQFFSYVEMQSEILQDKINYILFNFILNKYRYQIRYAVSEFQFEYKMSLSTGSSNSNSMFWNSYDGLKHGISDLFEGLPIPAEMLTIITQTVSEVWLLDYFCLKHLQFLVYCTIEMSQMYCIVSIIYLKPNAMSEIYLLFSWITIP